MLVAERHPTLSNLYPNDINLHKKRGCRLALAYFNLVKQVVRQIAKARDFDEDTEIRRKLLSVLITESELGQCLAKVGKDGLFFDLMTAKYLGFFNMSGGIRRGLTYDEFNVAYASFYFYHITQRCECNEEPKPQAKPEAPKPEEPGI